MKRVSRDAFGGSICLFTALVLLRCPMLSAEPLPLKRAVALALSHSTTSVSAELEQQRALASYHEARNQYLPTVVVGAGLGASWGFPLSLEGSAPSIFNVNAQSALLNPALRDFVRAAKTEWQASSIQTKDQINQALQASESIQIAETHVEAASLRARGEHRALLPMVDFATQYAVLSKYNNYSQFYKSFERNNATVGVAIRFPFLNPSQHAHAEAADAEALKARKNADAARNQVSDETLRLQRSVEQLAAAQQVASLEYQIAQSSVQSQQVRLDAGSATIHDLQDARDQANDRYNILQDSNFELERAQIALLRATGDLANWVGVSK